MKHIDFSAYQELAASFHDEIVTHSIVEDVTLPDEAGVLALVHLDNHHEKRPTTLGPNSLIELTETLLAQEQRANNGEISALAIIGKPGFLVAGADLGAVSRIKTKSLGRAMAELGHDAYNLIEDFPVPAFVFINGTALGGGLEIALAAKYRTVSSAAKQLALPEIFLGLVPGWGGVYRLPRITGPEAAAKIIFANALNNNKPTKAAEAFELALADALFDAESFLEESVDFVLRVLKDPQSAAEAKESRTPDHSEQAWQRAQNIAERAISSKSSPSLPAPKRALDLFLNGPERSREEDRQAECEALSDLMVTQEFANTVYAFLELLQKRAKRPAGVPSVAPRTVNKVGIVGAGLMASQLALVFAQQLKVPVVLTDVDEARVDKGLSYIESQLKKQAERGRLKPQDAEAILSLISGSTDKAVYADADFIIEAVFEEISVKKSVFKELEAIVSPSAILATNTSSLSVSEMSKDLDYPERVIGFHFFNPVAVMPLIEIARSPATTDEPIATAFALSAQLRKTPVLAKDATAFVVNRVLLRLMAEVQKTFDEGTPATTADSALSPLGLPMSPFSLLAMVGIPVAQHVTESLHASFGDRFYVSENLQRLIDSHISEIWSTDEHGKPFILESTAALLQQGDRERTQEEILTIVEDALAEEINLMLEEGVVAAAEDIDLCMILGAGWPLHQGGITPYLDQVGASERVNGKRFGTVGA